MLLEATIFHNLLVITSHDMMALLEAVHTFIATGTLWTAGIWSKKLGHKLSLFHWSAPSHLVHLPQDAAFTDDPQAMFSSMDTGNLLEAAIGDTPPLLPTLQTFPLQLSSSSSQASPPSSVITFNLEDHDPPPENEEPVRNHEPEKRKRRVRKTP